MAKKIKFESFKYRFLAAARQLEVASPEGALLSWEAFLDSLDFSYTAGKACVAWNNPAPGEASVDLQDLRLYVRGDDDDYFSRQNDVFGTLHGEDPVRIHNQEFFSRLVSRIARDAGFQIGAPIGSDRLVREREFHDSWANAEIPELIDVLRANQACTAPEMRYITERLGDIRGKRLLDIGCGLGEASVYFALLGADVTSSDLSQGMLDVTSRLAAANGVNVKQHIASAEDMQLPAEETFDIIYAGNLLHHVDIESTLLRLKPHLAPNGCFVSWDPLAYNPVINVYRRMATQVRTPDEHPLTLKDIRSFRSHFAKVETKYFWLTTLLIFVFMAVAQRRNPNKERYWKAVVQEGESWRRIYGPLELLDRVLLAILPPLRLLCWNVVVICRK